MRFLSNKEKKSLSDLLPKGYEFSKKDDITEGSDGLIYKNKEKFLIVLDGKFLPHLKSVPEGCFKAVYVDRGAIPFVIKGADLMRPGIRVIDDGFEKDEIVLIKDEEHKKTIAVGFALFSSKDMQSQEKGKSVKVFHYVGDSFY